MKAILVLEDGSIFEGEGLGKEGEKFGEVVFNTSMTGYQEILTDPSYCGQIVSMTYPLIGNYGINLEDVESSKVQVEGFVIKELSCFPGNWRAKETLDDYLKRNKIIGISGIDTRALTRRIRLYGAMKGAISTVDFNKKRLIGRVKDKPGIIGRDLVKYVTCKKPYKIQDYNIARLENSNHKSSNLQIFKSFNPKVVAIDYGIKLNILRMLVQAGCDVTVVPAKAEVEEILSYDPDGIFLSNGPGDPEGVPYAIETVKKLIGKKPIFGICLGHQMLGLAFGGKTYKLKFGHRGANHPVKNLKTGKVEITSQNHGFAVDINSIPDKNVVLSHINLYDNTAEGLEHKELPIFSVQYHPEASPGPHDSHYLFEKFIEMMEKRK